jgi:hypothetical protein
MFRAVLLLSARTRRVPIDALMPLRLKAELERCPNLWDAFDADCARDGRVGDAEGRLVRRHGRLRNTLSHVGRRAATLQHGASHAEA